MVVGNVDQTIATTRLQMLSPAEYAAIGEAPKSLYPTILGRLWHADRAINQVDHPNFWRNHDPLGMFDLKPGKHSQKILDKLESDKEEYVAKVQEFMDDKIIDASEQMQLHNLYYEMVADNGFMGYFIRDDMKPLSYHDHNSGSDFLTQAFEVGGIVIGCLVMILLGLCWRYRCSAREKRRKEVQRTIAAYESGDYDDYGPNDKITPPRYHHKVDKPKRRWTHDYGIPSIPKWSQNPSNIRRRLLHLQMEANASVLGLAVPNSVLILSCVTQVMWIVLGYFIFKRYKKCRNDAAQREGVIPLYN